MKIEKIRLDYEVYENPQEMSKIEQEIIRKSIEVTGKAYAPYSQFFVGAALLLENGEVITGANIENAAYPLCLCAERVALAAAESRFPGVAPAAIAVSVVYPKNQPAYPIPPCGACRQVLGESEARHGQNIRIILNGHSGVVYAFRSALDLLPFGFTPGVFTT